MTLPLTTPLATPLTLLDFAPFLPELLMVMLALGLLMAGAFRGDRATGTLIGLAIGGLLGIGAVTAVPALVAPEGLRALSGAFLVDTLAVAFKALILLATVICFLMSRTWLEKEQIFRAEFPVLILLALTGMMVMLSAGNFLVLYLGLELQSLSLYVLAAFQRDKRASCEAGLKYFLLGSLASGLLLFGISLIYGLTGSVSFEAVRLALTDGLPARAGLLAGCMLTLAALLFKVAAVPFHMWAPDVYEGAPTPVTAFFSVAPKAAGLGLLIRLLHGPFHGFMPEWQHLLAVVAAATMVVGGLAGVGQTSFKRLLAYSSIGHVGFVLAGISLGTETGLTAALTYLVFYVIMSLGTFAVLLLMRKQGRAVEEIADLAGLARLHPGLAAALAILMFSMAGIPPLVGFFTKLYVFLAAIKAGMVWLAVIGSLASVIAAYYYILVIKVMYVDKPITGLDQPFEPGPAVTLVVSSTLALAGLLMIGPVILLAHTVFRGLGLVP